MTPANCPRASLWKPALLALLAASAFGQINTGAIVGNIQDPQGLMISGADVSLVSRRTGDVRQTRSNEVGGFTFTAVPAGEYTLKIVAKGFQAFERQGLVLTSNEYLSAGTIALAVGSTTETITVSADSAVVQTASAENSALLQRRQIDMAQSRGRDVMSLLRLMPGVSQGTDPTSLGSQIGSSSPNVGGMRNNDNTILLDGQVSSDADNVNVHISAVSLDFIDEVKILANNYQAEYGRNAGAQVSIISKSGSREFHGGGSWFKRHEQFNANGFFNNLNNLPKPLYRYNNWTGTLGGPVTIPKLFNTGRQKLFFFYGHEHWRAFEPQNPQRSTMPTALERAGNFSQTVDLNGRLINVLDPLNGRTAFPGNVIPDSRLNENGRAILNLFPLPNFLDRSISLGSYNYQFQDVQRLPKDLDQLKIDYNPTSADRLSGRWRHWSQNTVGYGVTAGFSSNWNQLYHQYGKTEDSGLLNYSRTFGPTLVNEATFTFRKIGELGPPVTSSSFDKITRSKTGLGGLPQLYKDSNPYNIIPTATFGGVPSAPTINYDSRFWIAAGDTRWSVADNLSWTAARHLVKVGFYFERTTSDEGLAAASFGGSYNFGATTANPLDANYAFANAALGNFQSYSEANRRNFRGGKNWLAEWFAQDSWRVRKNLTLELGMRFSYFTPWVLQDGQQAAAWVIERYDPAQAVQLYQPARDGSGARVARNPVTGELLPAVLIGAITPGSGNPYNGMVTGDDKSYPAGWQEQKPVQLAPRFGFAWDVLGKGRTAVRGGFGVTKQTQFNSAYANSLVAAAPPIVITPTIYYGNINSLTGQTGALFPTANVRYFERDPKVASSYNFSLGVQQNAGFNTVIGVAYVGNFGKHLLQNRNLNTLSYGTRFLPSSADPTNPSSPLPDTFLAPYKGYQSISVLENSGLSNYHSLQVTANRRVNRGLQFGAAWTWSKAMNLSDGPANIPMFLSSRTWLYGKAGFDQTHTLVINYILDLPQFSKRIGAPVTRWVLDNWQISGFTTFASGNPSSVGYTTTDNLDITGGGDGARLNVIGKAQQPHGERTFSRWFNPAVFARPGRGDHGNAPKDVFRGPGINNWDLSVFKNFPIRSESRILQLRGEFYNAFNHTQFSGVDSTARFDTAGQQVNTGLGRVTSARSARVIQLALAFRF